MLTAKAFKKRAPKQKIRRLLFLQNGLESRVGHWLHEVKSWRRAVLSAGMEWHCFVHSTLSPEVAREVDALPVVPFLPGQVRRGFSPLQRLKSLVDGAEKLPAVLIKHYPDEPSSEDLLYVGYATDVEMIGVARWLEGLPKNNRPKVAFCIHHPSHEWTTEVSSMSLQGDFHRWIYAAKRVRVSTPEIRFLASIPALSEELSRVLEVPFETFAHNCQIPEAIDVEAIEPTYDIGILGSSRDDQGGYLYPDILMALKSALPNTRILLQCLPGEHESYIRSIMRRNGMEGMVTLATDAGLSQDMLSTIASCRLILLPYLPANYCLRSSGVFFEANCVGRPVVAPSETSMGRMILAGLSSGVAFRSMHAKTIAEAVCDGLDRHAELQRQAFEIAPFWRSALSAENLLKKLTGMFTVS
jgi:glycosyltransferase involved in cell wall biosynthesis